LTVQILNGTALCNIHRTESFCKF